MEDKETLKSGTVVGKLTDTVKDKVNNFLSDGVVSPRVVVGGVFFSVDDLLRVVKLGVSSATDFVTNAWFEIDVHSTRDVFSGLSFTEEGVEGVIFTAEGLIRFHLTIGGDPVLKAVQLPTVVTGLDTGLTQMDGDTF